MYAARASTRAALSAERFFERSALVTGAVIEFTFVAATASFRLGVALPFLSGLFAGFLSSAFVMSLR
jgi:hypothetical protein